MKLEGIAMFCFQENIFCFIFRWGKKNGASKEAPSGWPKKRPILEMSLG